MKINFPLKKTRRSRFCGTCGVKTNIYLGPLLETYTENGKKRRVFEGFCWRRRDPHYFSSSLFGKSIIVV